MKKYLLSFGVNRLEQSGKSYKINGKIVKSRKKTNNKWFETQDSISYWDDFNKQKIIWSEISDGPKFAIDKSGSFYITNKAFLLTGNENLLYLYNFLNSAISEKYFSFISSTTGEGTNQWFKYKVEQLPIPNIYKFFSSNIIYDNYYIIQNNLFDIYNFNSEEIKYIND